VVAELESLTAAHPLRERLRGQLMLALYRCGRKPVRAKGGRAGGVSRGAPALGRRARAGARPGAAGAGGADPR
jgi:hypothetical protein